jgi:hypothetical protein
MRAALCAVLLCAVGCGGPGRIENPVPERSHQVTDAVEASNEPVEGGAEDTGKDVPDAAREEDLDRDPEPAEPESHRRQHR